MKDFDAITATGTIYQARGGILTVRPENNRPYALKPIHLAAVDRKTLGLASLEDLGNLPQVEAPVVGLSLYASSLSEWRLSTPVIDVRLLDDKDPE